MVWEDYRKGKGALYAQRINRSGASLWSANGVALAASLKPQEKPFAAVSPLGETIVIWQDLREGNYDIYAQKISNQGELLWGDSGAVICNASGVVMHQNVSLISGVRSEVLLVFEDARSGFLNIYAQKISKSGTLMWGPNGIAVAKVKAHQTNPNLITDGAGGAIVVWEDGRYPDQTRIFAQRISASGKKVWSAGSLPLTNLNSKQSRPVMITDGAGGAIVAWQDERNPLGLKDLFGQHVSGNGDLLWGENGTAISVENGDQAEPDIAPDQAGGAIIAWSDYRNGERNPDIYVQRVNKDGRLLWQADGIVICGAPDIQRNPQIVPDGEGGAVVAWTDKGGGSYDIYAQHVNAAGQRLWLTDGIPVNQFPRTQQNPIICAPNILVWEDYRNGNWDIYASALSSKGKLLWHDEGVPIAALNLTQYAPQSACWNNGSTIIAWEDYRNGAQYEIFMQKISAEGKIAWPENGVLVQTTNGARAPKFLADPEQGLFVITWEDYTSGGKAIFGQRFIID